MDLGASRHDEAITTAHVEPGEAGTLVSSLVMATAIPRQAHRPTKLVNDLRDGVRLEGGLLVMEPRLFDLGALVRRFAAESASLGLSGLVIEAPSGEVAALGDPARVEQILTNLVDNAREYSPAGRPITLTLAVGDATAGVAVADEGAGIPAAEARRLFERFFRASNIAGVSAGLGLGLALSRALARRMGGDISVDSVGGRGSTFTLRLPRNGPAEG